MRAVALLFAVAVVGTCAAEWPRAFEFERFAFGDAGWAVTVNHLLDNGQVPTRDFSYVYGLLSLLVHRGPFAVFGTHPQVVGGLFVACAALVGFGAWRLLRALEVGVWPRLAFVLTIPLAANPGKYPSPVQALEAALLVHALAYHARGKLAAALLLATVAVLVKPSLGYFYGLMLVAQIALTPGTNRVRTLLPAAIVGCGLLLALVGTFGIDAVRKTQLPGEAGKVYRDQNCGFFHGDGRAFWDISSGGVIAYVFTPAGAWLAATFLTLLGGLVALGRVRSDPAARSLVALAGLHAVFVAVLFANRHSWIYYPYLPFLGAAVALDRLPRWVPAARAAVMAAGVLAGLLSVVMGYVTLNGAADLWTKTEPDPRTGWLYADPDTAEGWEQVQVRAADGGVFVLTRSSGAAAFGDGIGCPQGCYLSAPIATPTEWAALRAGIARSRWLLVPNWFENTLTTWPELADVLAPFRKVGPGPGYDWFRRTD